MHATVVTLLTGAAWSADEELHAGVQAEAMAASLAEEQGRKQTAAPLPEQPEAELRRRFARSLLLPQVGIVSRLAAVQRCSPALQKAVTGSDAAQPGCLIGHWLCCVGSVSLAKLLWVSAWHTTVVEGCRAVRRH